MKLELTQEQYAKACCNHDEESLGLSTACHKCKRKAYSDMFLGELHDEGYVCSYCVKELNQKAWNKHYEIRHVR